MKRLFLLVLVSFNLSILAQTDSLQLKNKELKAQIAKSKDDSTKIEYLFNYVDINFDENPELAQKLSRNIIEICSKKENLTSANKKYFLEKKSLSYNNLGILSQYKGEIKEALAYYKKGLEIDIVLKDKRSMADSYLNIGSTYDYLGDYQQAISYFQKSLKIQKEDNNQKGISDLYNNIGVIYNTLQQYDKSLYYYNLSLQIDRKLKEEMSVAITLSNIGSLYARTNDYPKALSYTKKSFYLSKKLNNEIGQGMTLGNIGSYYYELNKLDSANYYLEKSIRIFRKMENNQHLATFLAYLAKVKNKQKDFGKALQLAKEAFELSEETDDLSNKHSTSLTLYEIYKSKSDYKMALKYHEIYLNLEKSIQNDANKKQLLGFEFEKKLTEDSLKNIQKINIKNAQLTFAKKQNKINQEKIVYLIIGLAALFLLLLLIYNRFQITKRQKQTIEKQKVEVETQKIIIEEINKQIHESITYAEMIQQAVLPALAIDDMFEEAMLLYQPKDIVSGDFYWLEQQDKTAYFCVADCTGHGIPGAFISMIGTILLNEIFNSKGMRHPGLILNELSRLIQLTLMSRENKILNDGMDISFCALEKETKTLKFAGANNGIYILSTQSSLVLDKDMVQPKTSKNEVHLFKIDADKKPIGKHYSDKNHFTEHSISVHEGDLILLLSDGFVDQFGGPKGKKYKALQLEEILLENSQLPLKELKKLLLQSHTDWKGSLEQVDDVCVIAVRV